MTRPDDAAHAVSRILSFDRKAVLVSLVVPRPDTHRGTTASRRITIAKISGVAGRR